MLIAGTHDFQLHLISHVQRVEQIVELAINSAVALVFCSNADLECRLQGTARVRVCLRDKFVEVGRPAGAGVLAALRRRKVEVSTR